MWIPLYGSYICVSDPMGQTKTLTTEAEISIITNTMKYTINKR